jgi:hypothetical protein
MFVNYHEGHEEHEVEIIIYFCLFMPFMMKIRLFTISSMI